MRKLSYRLTTLLVIASMLMTACEVTPTPTVEVVQETECDLTTVSLEAPWKMVEGHAEYIAIQGGVMGEGCESVELVATADEQTVLAEVFDVHETDSFLAYAEILPASEVHVHAVTNAGYQLTASQRIEVVEEAAVPRVDLVIEGIETDADEGQHAVHVGVVPQSEEPLTGIVVCMAPCVEDGYYSLRASSSDIYADSAGTVTMVMLPACVHPTFITCRAVNDDVELPDWAVLASSTATALVDGLEEADVGDEERAAAQEWAQSIAPLYPFANASRLLNAARALDLEENVIEMDMTDAQDPESQFDERDLPFLRVMIGRGWRDLPGSRNLGFFFVPGESPDIEPPEDIPPVPLAPPEDILFPPGEAGMGDPLKDLGIEKPEDLADPLKLRGLRAGIDEMTDPEGDASKQPMGSPFGFEQLPRNPTSMTPGERFRTILGSEWTNFARSLNTPPGGHRPPVSSSDPTYAGGWFGKVVDTTMDVFSVVGEAVGGAVGGAAAAVTILWTVGKGLYQAVTGEWWGCHNYSGSGQKHCRERTDETAKGFDPKLFTNGEWCRKVHSGDGVGYYDECLKKTEQKQKDFCKQNPNHENCKSDEKPKKPKKSQSASRCDPDVNPDCDDMLDPKPKDFKKGEKHVLNITLKVCSSTESEVMPGQHCEVVNRARMALAAKKLEAWLCKQRGTLDVKCERRQVIAMRPIVKHRPDPVSPDPTD